MLILRREMAPQQSIHRIAVKRQSKDASFMVAVLVVVVVSAMLVFSRLGFARGCCVLCGRLAIVVVRE
jgi:hypothetical protein